MQLNLIDALNASITTEREKRRCAEIGKEQSLETETAGAGNTDRFEKPLTQKLMINEREITRMSTTIQESALRIIHPTDPIVVEHPIFHIFGGPGLGKTSIAMSSLNPIVLNSDSDSALARCVNRRASMNVLTVEEMEALLADPSILAPFDTVVLDTVGGFVDVLAAFLIKDNPKLGRADGGPTQQGYGTLKSRFRGWITTLKSEGKNIFFVSHNKEDKATNDVVYNRPDITGGSKDIVMRLSDFVGFLHMSGKQRMLDFNPTEAYFAKNPRGLWKPWKVPAPEKASDFMTKLFNEGRSELSKLSEASASVAQQVEAWRTRIDVATTAEQLNTILSEYRGLSPILEPQVRTLLRQRAEAMAIEYDTSKKLFLNPILQPQLAGVL